MPGPADTPLALTLGDPAGIGLDITLLAFLAREQDALPPFVFLGDRRLLEQRAEALGLAVPMETIGRPSDAAEIFSRALPVLPIPVPVAVAADSSDTRDGSRHIIKARTGAGEARRHQPHFQSPVSGGRNFRHTNIWRPWLPRTIGILTP